MPKNMERNKPTQIIGIVTERVYDGKTGKHKYWTRRETVKRERERPDGDNILMEKSARHGQYLEIRYTHRAERRYE